MRRIVLVFLIVALSALCSCSAHAQRSGPSIESGAPGDPTAPASPPSPEIVERLHDIRGPVAFAPPWRVVDYAALAGAAMAGLALLLTAWAIARGRVPRAEPAAAPLPAAHEAALARLRELADLNLFGQGGRDGHLRLATEVPRILKGFLDAVYATGSVYLTTTETHSKTGAAMGLEWGRAVAAVLVSCDRVKFAGQAALASDPIPEAERIVAAVADVMAAHARAGRPAA